MRRVISKVLLGSSSALLIFGGALHALAFFSKSSAAIDKAAVSPFFASELKGLWLTDSTTLIAVGVMLALAMLRSSTPPLLKLSIILLSSIPAATAAVLYWFLGGFFAAHLLMVAAALAVLAALLMQGSHPAAAQLRAGFGPRAPRSFL
jgi:hypothetical protein